MERRQHYRVSDKPFEDLAVIVVPTQGPPLNGELVDLSASGVGVDLAPGLQVELEPGERVILVIGSHQLESPLTAAATAVFSRLRGERTRCGFQLIDPARVMEQAGESLRRKLNERHGRRVQPSSESPIAVAARPGTEHGPEGVVGGQLIDLSIVGLSVDFPAEAGHLLVEEAPVDIELSLPGQANDVTVRGIIRHRLPMGDMWRVGIELDPRASLDFSRHQRAIASYVSQRWREMEVDLQA